MFFVRDLHVPQKALIKTADFCTLQIEMKEIKDKQ